jgi:predicted RNA-binding protein with EMAP domain
MHDPARSLTRTHRTTVTCAPVRKFRRRVCEGVFLRTATRSGRAGQTDSRDNTKRKPLPTQR